MFDVTVPVKTFCFASTLLVHAGQRSVLWQPDGLSALTRNLSKEAAQQARVAGDRRQQRVPVGLQHVQRADGRRRQIWRERRAEAVPKPCVRSPGMVSRRCMEYGHKLGAGLAIMGTSQKDARDQHLRGADGRRSRGRRRRSRPLTPASCLRRRRFGRDECPGYASLNQRQQIEHPMSHALQMGVQTCNRYVTSASRLLCMCVLEHDSHAAGALHCLWHSI